MTQIARPIDRVNELFLERSMEDPIAPERSFVERLTTRPLAVVERHASIKLPDLKTIVIVQDGRDTDDIRPLIQRTPRVVEVGHKISVMFALRKKRTEMVSIGLAYHGQALDRDDMHDPEEMAELRETLEIPSTLNILDIVSVENDVPVRNSIFYFNPEGTLRARHQVGAFDSTFSLLTNAVVISSSPVVERAYP